jgi:hypothetical protein
VGFTILYVETRIDTMEDLERHIGALDEDEGIRTVGNFKSPVPDGYIFITKSNDRYCVNVCERVWDAETSSYKVGGNDKYFYFDTFEKVWTMIKSIIRLPLEAWLY